MATIVTWYDTSGEVHFERVSKQDVSRTSRSIRRMGGVISRVSRNKKAR